MVLSNVQAGAAVWYVSLVTRLIYAGRLTKPGSRAVVDLDYGPTLISPAHCFLSQQEAKDALDRHDRQELELARLKRIKATKRTGLKQLDLEDW